MSLHALAISATVEVLVVRKGLAREQGCKSLFIKEHAIENEISELKDSTVYVPNL